MIVVIVAGGSGTRLWPLSKPDFPKHLAPIVGKTSLLQQTYRRARKITREIYIVTEASHADEARSQLPELSESYFIVEPGRRGTGNCFIAALHHISKKDGNNQPIAFMHADHQINDVDAFANVVRYAGEISDREKRITLLGVEPSYAAVNFGYIHKGEQLKGKGEEFVYSVRSFTEKPNIEKASQYQRSGEYLWNMGYFVAPLKVFLEKIKQNAPKLYRNYQALQKTNKADSAHTYLGFENLVIDYELMETTPDLLVVSGTFDWVDVGSFDDLPKVMQLDSSGNHVHGDSVDVVDVSGSYIRNDEPNKPVVVIGLSDVAVINTPNGILVTNRQHAQKVGEVSKRLNKL